MCVPFAGKVTPHRLNSALQQEEGHRSGAWGRGGHKAYGSGWVLVGLNGDSMVGGRERSGCLNLYAHIPCKAVAVMLVCTHVCARGGG